MASNSVIVVGPQFCAPDVVDLAVIRKAKDIRIGNFAITDVNGKPIFKIEEKLLSLHGRRVLFDAAGNPLLSLKGKTMTAHCRWRVFRGHSDDPSDLLFTVKKSSMIPFKTDLDVILASNANDDVCDFKVKGCWSKKSCTISIGDSNTIIAQLDKENTIMGEVPADAFMVKVYPNIDRAFIIALISILDAIYSNTDGNDAEIVEGILELGDALCTVLTS